MALTLTMQRMHLGAAQREIKDHDQWILFSPDASPPSTPTAGYDVFSSFKDSSAVGVTQPIPMGRKEEDSADWGMALWKHCEPLDEPIDGSCQPDANGAMSLDCHDSLSAPLLSSTPVYRAGLKAGQRRRSFRRRALYGSHNHHNRPHCRQIQPAVPQTVAITEPLKEKYEPINLESVKLPTPESLDEVFFWHDVSATMEAGGHIELAAEGEGAAYFCRDSSGAPMAVFKPCDEEPGALENPRGGEPPLLGGIRPGSGYLREVAAYRLDHGGSACVPMTTAIKVPKDHSLFSKDKVGSLQQFVRPSEGCTVHAAADLTPGGFRKEDVHRIGVLDLRLGNCDRHGGNILAIIPEDRDRSCIKLVPIDHGYVLPVTMESFDFEWQWWAQSAMPFSEETLEYIDSLDPDKDAAVLRELGIEEGAIDVMKATTLLLKLAAKAGLTLRQIANLVRRPQLAEPSACEKVLERLRRLSGPEGVDWAQYQVEIREQMDLHYGSLL